MKKFNLFGFLVMFCGCLFFAACSGNDGEVEIEVPGGDDNGEVLDGKLMLSASASFINNDGQDASIFTVKKGDTDITNKAKIYLNNAVFEGVSFSTTKVGDYTFFATYDGEISDKITVKVIEGIPDLPEDTQAGKFEGFVHRVLAVQSTGTWCQYCPFMMAGIKSYLKDYDHENTIFVAAHNSDIMANQYSNTVNSWINVTGYPTLSLNLDSKNKIPHANAPDATAKAINNAIVAALKEDVHVGISASVSGTENSGTLAIRAKVKIGMAGQYRIGAWLLEDGIHAEQQNSTGLSDDFSIHNSVLRYGSSASAYGVQLGKEATSSKGDVEEFACSFNLADAKVTSLANCRVVIFVTTPKNGKFAVDNVVTCPINGSIAFEYE